VCFLRFYDRKICLGSFSRERGRRSIDRAVNGGVTKWSNCSFVLYNLCFVHSGSDEKCLPVPFVQPVFETVKFKCSNLRPCSFLDKRGPLRLNTSYFLIHPTTIPYTGFMLITRSFHRLILGYLFEDYKWTPNAATHSLTFSVFNDYVIR
jgi:hypothetical protein